ncbi:MAG: 4-phosphopantetheinyl transferase family protein [Flavobacteriaceae bacterium]|nr:4-phosphopantetheinyl transferase family protein [Flavobacteriaceae bacterium]
MIGNDIVDLELALKESNWKRKGYLDKIFTKQEQLLISKSDNPENMVWNLWSRKESAYKIFNRISGIRIYNPIKFECFDTDKSIGMVINKGVLYYTKTEINNDYIHTVSVLNKTDFESVKFLNRTNEIIKMEGIPCLIKTNKKRIQPVSISNHGNFEKIVSLC